MSGPEVSPGMMMPTMLSGALASPANMFMAKIFCIFTC